MRIIKNDNNLMNFIIFVAFKHIRFVSITETCTHASKNYLSTLAVLQLDAILTNARVVSTVRSKDNSALGVLS